MKYYIIGFLLVFSFSSCNFIARTMESFVVKEQQKKKVEKEEKVKYVKKKEGEMRYQYPSGKLKSIVNYKNGKKIGMSHTYYESGEKQYDIPYVDGKKHGKVIWYYKSGKIYRETDYVKGKRTGWVRKYWEDGSLKSEIEMKNNCYATNLKEISNTGKVKKKPYITVQRIDKIQENGEYTLRFTLHNGRKNAKFYSGKLIEGKYFPANGRGFAEIPSRNGLAEIKFNLPPDYEINNDVNVVTFEKTAYQNKRVLSKKVSVSIRRE